MWSPILDLQVWGQCVHGKRPRLPGSISRRLSSFPGLLDLCVAPLFECMRGEGSPSSPVMSAGLKLHGVDFCMAYAGLKLLGVDFCLAYAGLYAVFESLWRPALLSLPRSELFKHQLLR